MSFYKTNRNAGRTNRAIIYASGHDIEIEFTLVVRGSEWLVTVLEAHNTSTGKDTGLSDERLVSLIKDEIRSRGVMVFNYLDVP